MLFNLTVISNFDCRLFCWSIWMLWARMSSWMSCLYCSLFSAQLWSRLLSRCCPNNGGGAVNVFQSSLKGIFVDDCSRYLASRLFGKFKLKGGGEIWLIDGVDGSDNVSGSDEDVVVSVEISIGSFTKFSSPCVNDVLSNMVVVMLGFGGLKGFSRICLDVGVEPK